MNDSMIWTDEYNEGVRYGLQGKIIVEVQSPYQKIKIIDTKKYGNALLLDNCWMTAEGMEKNYHECLIQPALCSSEELKKVLLIGGGDGGSARECLKHEDLEKLDMVEIDPLVIDLSKKYLPSLGGKAWKDPRLNIHIQNGIDWVANSKNNYYNVIIIDGSDPVGPAKDLLKKEFFEDCKRILKPEGVFATQSASPESFKEIHIEIIKTLREVFNYADPLYGSVPIYPSGWWSWTFASDKESKYLYPIKNRAKNMTNKCEVWSPKWQKGGFHSIPAFIERKLKK